MKASATGRGVDWSGPAPVMLGILGCALFALAMPPVPDHAYQFHLAERVLGGARLYVDVAAADMHPPLFTWLAMALETGARPLGLSGLDLFPLATVLTIAGSLFAVWRIGPQSGYLHAVLLVALMAAAGPYFGQGEHFALTLALPYLFATAAALRGRTPRAGIRIAIAVTAAIGLAMKPHFGLVWVCAECYLARSRGIRSLWRIESIVIAAVFSLYVFATALVTPEFFDLLPWLLRLYPRFVPVPFGDILFDPRSLLLAAGLLAGRAVARDSERAPLADLLSLAALAMFSAVLLQEKGWGYHWYPVNALAIVLIGLAAEARVERIRRLVPVAAIIATIAVIATNRQVDRTFRLLAAPPTFLPELLRITEQHGAGRPVVALSHYLHPAFPLVNLAGTQWVLPYAHLWMVPAIYFDRWMGGAPTRYRDAGEWTSLEQQMFDRIWESIERSNPALIVVEKPIYNDFDMRSYFETDARFRALFRAATVIDTIGYYVVYRSPAAAIPRVIASPH